MPPARVARRAITDENAETTGTTRLTRAKAAALDNASAGEAPKKAILTKRSTTATTGTIGTRKRTALGDVSNVTKKETSSNADAKKDPLSKPLKPAGVQKTQSSRVGTTRNASVHKAATASSELKRPASGSGIASKAAKKRNTSVTKVKRDMEGKDDENSENAPPPRNGVKGESQKKTRAKVEEIVPEEPVNESEKSLEELIKEAKDLDTEDLEDPLMVAEYVHEIFDYMKELEISTMPNPDYMDDQVELEWKMRGILVDWLLEVHTRFRLLPETLFLTVNIIDRFLSSKVVQLDRLQLVGVTAMFIASKYEEVVSPHIRNFVHVGDDGFKDTEILSAERFILSTLDYDLSYPNPLNFLRRISKADSYDVQTRTLGKYLLEIGCLDHRFLSYPPSQIAGAAIYLARLALQRGEWSPTLAKYSGYTESEIQPVFLLMVDYLSSPVTHEAFFRKYAAKKYLKASIVLGHWAKKWSAKYLHETVDSSSGKASRP